MRLRRILAALSAILILLTFSACNKANSAREAVELFEAAMNENDFRTAFNYVSDYDGFGFSDGSEDIIKAVAASMKIDIISETGGASSSAIVVDIKSVDLRQVYCSAAALVIPKYYTAAITGGSISDKDLGNEMVSEVVSLSKSSAAPTFTTRLTLTVVKDKNDKWVIRLDTAAYNAITGYLDEANNLITTGTISQAIHGETDFLAGVNDPQGSDPSSPSDVTSNTDAD